MPKLSQLATSRRSLLVVGLGILAWLFVGGFALLDALLNVNEPGAPTAAALLPSHGVQVPTATVPTMPTLVPTVTRFPTSTRTTLPTITPEAATAAAPDEASALPMVVLPASSPASRAAGSMPTLLPPLVAVSATDAEAAYGGTLSAVPAEALLPEVTGVATPEDCPPPAGWVPYRIEEGDTLFGFQLGAEGRVDVATIRSANCLEDNLLLVGQLIFLPPGVAENSPKVDDSPPPLVDAPSVAGAPRTAACPCEISVRAGWRLEQIAAAIDAVPAAFTGRDFLAVTGVGAAAPPHWFLSGRPAGASLEGFMFPGSYTVDNSTTAEGFRNMLLDAFAANVPQALEAGPAARGLNFWQAVNMASIVEREAGDPTEQGLVASVFYNRLASGRGLGSYPTLQYALGVPGNWWPRINASNAETDTPYNTLLYRGLPPTPIGSPGLSAIVAVANAPATDYMFFSARCDGLGNFYVRTYEEFLAGLDCR